MCRFFPGEPDVRSDRSSCVVPSGHRTHDPRGSPPAAAEAEAGPARGGCRVRRAAAAARAGARRWHSTRPSDPAGALAWSRAAAGPGGALQGTPPCSRARRRRNSRHPPRAANRGCEPANPPDANHGVRTPFFRLTLGKARAQAPRMRRDPGRTQALGGCRGPLHCEPAHPEPWRPRPGTDPLSRVDARSFVVPTGLVGPWCHHTGAVHPFLLLEGRSLCGRRMTSRGRHSLRARGRRS